jgi:hypothetical protein
MIRSPSGVSRFRYPQSGPKPGGKVEGKARTESAARERQRAKAKSTT